MRRPLILAITLALAACGDRADPAPAPIESLEQATAAASEASVSGPSFADWDGRLHELVTLDMAAEAAGLAAADAEAKAEPGAAMITYRWASERTRDVMGTRMPAWDEVFVGYLNANVPPEQFAARFTPVSDEAREQAADDAERRAREKGLDDQNARLARDLVASLSEVKPSTPVDGLGDAAVWESANPGMLHVLVNNTSLQLRVTVSDDDVANRDATVALARRVVDQL